MEDKLVKMNNIRRSVKTGFPFLFLNNLMSDKKNSEKKT